MVPEAEVLFRVAEVITPDTLVVTLVKAVAGFPFPEPDCMGWRAVGTRVKTGPRDAVDPGALHDRQFVHSCLRPDPHHSSSSSPGGAARWGRASAQTGGCG